MDFAEHDEKIFAGSGRRIGRRLPRLSSPRALQGEDVGGGDKKGIEDVGSRKEKQGVEKLKPLEDRPRPEEDQFEKEVLVGKGIAEIEHHPGRRGEHACEEGSHLKDLPNHDVHSSEQPLGLSGSVLGTFRILRASRREEARAEFDCPRRIHLAKEPSPWLSPRLGMDPGGIEPVDFPARKALDCLIKPFEVVHRQLSEPLSFPGATKPEIAFELFAKDLFSWRLDKQRETPSGTFETERGMRDIKEAKRAQMTEKRGISVQVVRKTPRSSLPRVHVGEGEDGRGRTGGGVEVQRELIGEIARRWLTRRRDLGGSGGKELLGNAQLVREKTDFLLFGFEVVDVRDKDVQGTGLLLGVAEAFVCNEVFLRDFHRERMSGRIPRAPRTRRRRPASPCGVYKENPARVLSAATRPR